MKLGFIGVGKIATSVIEGIFNAKINIREIILSPKNRQNANSLRNKFKKIKIAKSNQDVLDNLIGLYFLSLQKLESRY